MICIEEVSADSPLPNACQLARPYAKYLTLLEQNLFLNMITLCLCLYITLGTYL